MYEHEQNKITHLMVLLWNTILSISMIGWTLSNGQGPMAAVLLTSGLIVCWAAHLTGALTARSRLWLYTALLMMTFFFFGTHEQSVYDTAPVIVGFILVYTATDDPRFLRVCAAVYYLTMIYDFAFLPAGTALLPSYRLSRIAIHFLIVLMSERMGEAMIQKAGRERRATAQTIARLEESNRSAEDFLANVSHELRTPINAVTGITGALLKSEEDERRREQLLSVQQAGNRLCAQVEDVLDYSEIDTGRIRISEDTYSITSLISDVIAENRRLRQPSDVELIYDVDPKIPAVLLGDGKKIKKVIKHVIVNAMKFTRKGGIHVQVNAMPKAYGVNLCIRVSDTGVGIAAEELEKITERFFQADSGRNRRNGGLGLGLSIVYGMVAAMGGFVQIQSKEGVGTTVSISVPQKVVDDAPCMAVNRRQTLCPALYLLPEKYEVPEVRDQYNQMISHMIRGLDIPVHRVFDLEELRRLVSSVALTHLFIGEAEYQEDPAYYERLAQTMKIIAIAGDGVRLAQGSAIQLVQKPFYSLPIVNLMNDLSVSEDGAAQKKVLSCSGVRVLVVDDEPMNLLVVENLLAEWNIQVTTADSGMKAIELCREKAFDLVFLDHMMPEMDGVDALKELREIWASADKKPAVIAFTANVVGGAREMFLQEGFDDFIAKPVEERELRRLLKRVLPEEAIVYVPEGGEARQAMTGRAYLEKNGFLVTEAMRYCGHDGAFYEEMLLRFARESEEKSAQLEQALDAQDLKTYRIVAHTLKSSAKMIGAQALSEMARRAEEAARDGETAYLRAHHEALLARYRETARCIEGIPMPEKEAAAGVKIGRTELLSRLRALREACDTYESDAAETLLAEIGGLSDGNRETVEALAAIRRDVEDFEWAAAQQKTRTLIGRLEAEEA